MDSFEFPNVEALLLNIYSSNYKLPRFISTMKKLKVVVIINHGPNSATLTNLSCLSSLPKLKRIRLEKVSITFLDIFKLQSLKKLSLFMSCFGQFSHDKNEIDVSKALSSLQEVNLDYCYDLEKLPNWISEAVSLEKLSITNCHKLSMLPEAIGNLSKLELLRLCSCISLSEAELPETIVRLSNLQFLDISHYLGLKKLPLEIGRLEKLKKISMNKCWKCEVPDSVRNLENLEVKCDEETAVVLWKGLGQKMINLNVQVEETEHNLNLLPLL